MTATVRLPKQAQVAKEGAGGPNQCRTAFPVTGWLAGINYPVPALCRHVCA